MYSGPQGFFCYLLVPVLNWAGAEITGTKMTVRPDAKPSPIPVEAAPPARAAPPEDKGTVLASSPNLRVRFVKTDEPSPRLGVLPCQDD